MKRRAVVTEVVTYYIEFDTPDGANDEAVEDLAHQEWGANPGRKPDNYECDIEVIEI